ncbi:MAG: hypothetical protein K6B46_03130 [Opitutales bacterium]|nr:hypothetical protein [Opitutales bacterium]
MVSRQSTSLVAAGAFLSLFFSACSTYPERAAKIRDACGNQDYATAVELAKQEAENANENDRLQWQLDYATTLWLQQDFRTASGAWDDALKTFEYWDEKADTLISKEISAGLSNLSALPYRGQDIDRIMLHTYRALTYLELGDIAAARPALNAAYREQTLAVERNAKEIEKAKDESQKEEVDQKTLAEQNDKINKKLEEEQKNDFQFEHYADYVNPFTTWLYGIYFLHAAADSGDIERSRNALERVNQMVPGNPVVKADLDLIAGGRKLSQPVTYIIYEYGKIANLREWRLDLILPDPITGSTAPFAIALPRINCPRLDPKTSHANNYEIPYMKANDCEAALVCDMNRVRVTEFHNKYPSIVMRTLTTAIIKTTSAIAVNTAARKSNSLAFQVFSLIGTSVYTLGSAGADLRVWQTLPRSFSIARIPTPENKKITVSVAGRELEIDVPDAKVSVIYVNAESYMRAPRASAFVLKK